MSPRTIITIILVVVGLLLAGVVVSKTVGICNSQEWIFVQPYWGDAYIQNDSGLYWKGVADTWAYPRYMEFRYNDDDWEGDRAKESIRVTFNDGATSQISTFVKVQTPMTEEEQITFHKLFGGNLDSIKASVKAHMINCLKSAAPLMSVTEHQSARKAEFSQIVEDQLTKGLYKMRQIEKELKDRTDEKGEPITVMATEVVLDGSGTPMISQPSPLSRDYFMNITQFSITASDYDPEALKQFAAKKEAFLAAEKSKAERESMVQERLKIEEEGLKDKAQAEAKANVEKATAVIQAEQKAEVALQTKIEAETKANQLLEVAKIEKEEAQVQLDTAALKAKAIIELAKAEQEKIRLAGAITELEQAEIDARIEIMKEFAKSLPLMSVPSTVISGVGNGEGSSNGMTEAMMPILMMKMMGLDGIEDMGKVKTTNMSDRSVIQRNQPKVSQESSEPTTAVAQK